MQILNTMINSAYIINSSRIYEKQKCILMRRLMQNKHGTSILAMHLSFKHPFLKAALPRAHGYSRITSRTHTFPFRGFCNSKNLTPECVLSSFWISLSHPSEKKNHNAGRTLCGHRCFYVIFIFIKDFTEGCPPNWAQKRQSKASNYKSGYQGSMQ